MVRLESVEEGGEKHRYVFSFVEGYATVSLLWRFDDLIYPPQMPRNTLYPLIKKMMDKMGIECHPTKLKQPSLWKDKYDGSRIFKIDLSIEDMSAIYSAIGSSCLDANQEYPSFVKESAKGVLNEMRSALWKRSTMIEENQRVFQEIFGI